MVGSVDPYDVPYWSELIEYLPINPEDSEDITAYISNLSNVVAVNYHYEQFQFSYFGIHLMYMTYLYCAVAKVSTLCNPRYLDVGSFAKPYPGKKIDIGNIKSIFDYSKMMEAEIGRFFRAIDLDKDYIKAIKEIVQFRNNMAHASGQFEIKTRDDFNDHVLSILTSIQNIHDALTPHIHDWFVSIMCGFAQGSYRKDFSDAKDIIQTVMIQDFNISKRELMACVEIDVSDLRQQHPEWIESFDIFDAKLQETCIELGYIDKE